MELGDPKSSPATPIFSADGQQALVTRAGDHRISVLNIDGAKVTAATADTLPWP